MEYILFALDFIGTIAFAISGCMVGIKKRMDLLGCLILGIITAVGGGIMRDIVMGKLPPLAFTHPFAAEVSAGISILIFAIVYFKHEKYVKMNGKYFQFMLFVADTLGLAIFTVVGVQAAIDYGNGKNLFFCVFLGTITGVGGGLIRDILSNNPPYILYRHIYACASIFGAILTSFLWSKVGKINAMLIGMISICIIRYFSSKYKWNLPIARELNESKR